MVQLNSKIRKAGKVGKLREAGVIPGVLYGPKIKSVSLEIELKGFRKVYNEVGESRLISLKLDDKEEYLVLIHEVQLDSITGTPLHADFYQPNLKERVQVAVPIIFIGEAPAIKELGATLLKNISEIEVKALPQELPQNIKADISGLKSFEDHILVKDLNFPKGVEVLRLPEEIVAQVMPPTKAEEELQKPIEEKVEEVVKIEKKKGGEEALEQ